MCMYLPSEPPFRDHNRRRTQEVGAATMVKPGDDTVVDWEHKLHEWYMVISVLDHQGHGLVALPDCRSSSKSG